MFETEFDVIFASIRRNVILTTILFLLVGACIGGIMATSIRIDRLSDRADVLEKTIQIKK